MPMLGVHKWQQRIRKPVTPFVPKAAPGLRSAVPGVMPEEQMTESMKIIYKITYPNGKIYIGKDLTNSINYWGMIPRLAQPGT